jgi:hypothetical protein
MSNPTAEILQKLGGYQLECRGEREVKVLISLARSLGIINEPVLLI